MILNSDNRVMIRNNLVGLFVFESVLASLIFAWKKEGLAITYNDYFLSKNGVRGEDDNSRITILIRSIAKYPLKLEIIHIIQNLYLSSPLEFFCKLLLIYLLMRSIDTSQAM